MRQVHVRQPWADLASGFSETKLLESLMARIEVLEARLKALETRIGDRKLDEDREVLPLGV